MLDFRIPQRHGTDLPTKPTTPGLLGGQNAYVLCVQEVEVEEAFFWLAVENYLDTFSGSSVFPQEA